MFSYHPTFAAPAYLAALALAGALVVRLSPPGRAGPLAALVGLAAPHAVVVLLVMAAADMQIVRINDHLTVIYLLDQSLSIPEQQRAAMIKYVKRGGPSRIATTRTARA